MRKHRTADDFVQIGQIVGVFGLKGHFKVKVLTDFWQRFEPGQSVWILGVERKIRDTKWHRDQARILVEGVSTPEEAEALRWQYLEVPKSHRPQLGNDEYYVDDLMGFAVVDPSGEHLGTIRDVVSSPAHDILDIDGVLVPAVNQFILEIDMDRKQIVLQPIPGLFDEGEA